MTRDGNISPEWVAGYVAGQSDGLRVALEWAEKAAANSPDVATEIRRERWRIKLVEYRLKEMPQ